MTIPRIAPLQPPYGSEVAETLDKMMNSQASRLEKFGKLMSQAQQEQEPSLDDLLSGDTEGESIESD